MLSKTIIKTITFSVLFIFSFKGFSQNQVICKVDADASILKNKKDNNFGSRGQLHFYPQSNNAIKRFLVRFDLASIPSNTTVKSAKIVLVNSNSRGFSSSIKAHLVNTSWKENTITWTSLENKFESQSSATTTLNWNYSNNKEYSWDVTSDVIKMANGTLVNNGWLFKEKNNTTSPNFWYFHSKEAAEQYRPKLIVTYEKKAISPIVLTEEKTQNITTNGGKDGSATVSISGGTGNYKLKWSPEPATGQGTNSISSLSAGTYTLLVTDASDNSISQAISIILTEPSQPDNQNPPGVTISENIGAICDNSSILDIQSDEKGVLIPRITKSQRDLIPTPAQGLLVYIKDDNSFHFWNQTAWEKIGSNGSQNVSNSDLTFDGSHTADISGNDWLIKNSTQALFEINKTNNIGYGGLSNNTVAHRFYNPNNEGKIAQFLNQSGLISVDLRSNGRVETYDSNNKLLFQTYAQSGVSHLNLWDNGTKIVNLKDGDGAFLNLSGLVIGGTTKIGTENISLQGDIYVDGYSIQKDEAKPISDANLVNNSYALHIQGGVLKGRYKNDLGVVTNLAIGSSSGANISSQDLTFDGSHTADISGNDWLIKNSTQALFEINKTNNIGYGGLSKNTVAHRFYNPNNEGHIAQFLNQSGLISVDLRSNGRIETYDSNNKLLFQTYSQSGVSHLNLWDNGTKIVNLKDGSGSFLNLSGLVIGGNAKKGTEDISLQGETYISESLKIEETLTLTPTASPPASPTAGVMYMHDNGDGTSTLKVWNGVEWKSAW